MNLTYPCLIIIYILYVLCGVEGRSALHLRSSKYRRTLSDEPMQRSIAEKCGHTWQNHYTKLHDAIKSGRLPQRYMVSVGVEAGMADRLTGLITEFMFALLTDRALVTYTYDALPDWSDAYDYPHVNLALPEGFNSTVPAEVLDVMKYTYRGVRGFRGGREYSDAVDKSKFMPIYVINDDVKSDAIFGHSDLRTYNHHGAAIPYPPGNPVEYVFMASNRGRTYLVFQNEHHNATLAQTYGLTPDYAFGCFFHYLFRLKPEACDESCQYIQRQIELAHANNVQVIGINIRVGDHVFTNDSVAEVELIEVYMDCVVQLQPAREELMGYNGSLYYFISDSLKTRQKMKELYGDMVLTDTSYHNKHIDCKKHNKNDCAKEIVKEAIQKTAAQWHLFAMTDVQVATAASGFGTSGAYLSMRGRQGLYTINGRHKRMCGPNDYTDMRKYALQGWSGK